MQSVTIRHVVLDVYSCPLNGDNSLWANLGDPPGSWAGVTQGCSSTLPGVGLLKKTGNVQRAL